MDKCGEMCQWNSDITRFYPSQYLILKYSHALKTRIPPSRFKLVINITNPS